METHSTNPQDDFEQLPKSRVRRFSSNLSLMAKDFKNKAFPADEDKITIKACCDSDSFKQCLTRCMESFIRNALRSGAIRLILIALTTRKLSAVW